MQQNRVKPWVAQDNFEHTPRRRIFTEDRVDLFPHGSETWLLSL